MTYANSGLYRYPREYPSSFMSFVGAFRIPRGTGMDGSSFAASSARLYASYARVDLGASERYDTRCARLMRHSGIPIT